MRKHQRPFESLPRGSERCLADAPGLGAAPAAVGFLLLQSTSESTLQDALTSELGFGPPSPHEASARGDYALLWLTPTEWLLEVPARKIGSLRATLSQRLATSFAVVTDMSDAYACCEVRGAPAAEALMSGCNLDVRPQAFPAGRVARTSLADVPAIIWNPGNPDRLRCLVDRSFAGHLRDWLVAKTRSEPLVSA